MSDYSEYIKPFLKAFDEACAKAFENGAENERERIIKLLDSLIQITSADLTEQVSKNNALCEAIALIKGETNG